MAKDISEEKFSSKVSLNMITNITRVAVMALAGLLMVPYYIDQFGMATYALLPLVMSLNTYVQIASDSLGEAFARYLTIDLHSKDKEHANVTYSSSVIVMIKVVILALPAILMVSILAPFIFSTGSANDLEVQLMFFMIMLSSLLVSFVTCLNSVFMAYNYLYWMYIMRIVHTLLQVGLVFLFFFVHGPSLILLGLSYIISTILLVFFMFYGVKKIDPELKVSKADYDKSYVREMSGLGGWSMLAKIGDLMFIQASIIIVNITLGAESQGQFSIAANVISMIFTVCMSISAVGVPLAYKYYTEKNEEGMHTTLSIFTKFAGLIMAFPLAYLCIFAPQILQVWLTDEYPIIVTILHITIPICLARCIINILEYIPILYVKVRPMSLTICALGVLNIILAIVLVSFTDLDVYGVCIAWCASMIILDLIFFPLYISHLMGISKLTFYKPLIINYAVFGILIGLGAALCTVFTLPSTWLAVIVSAIVPYLIYLFITMRYCLRKKEKEIMITYFPERARGVMRKIMM